MATERIVPKALQKGDVIAFVSPSNRFNRLFPAPHQRAVAFFEKLGYTVKEIFNERKPEALRDFILQRCEEIHEAFRDPTVKAVFCTLGGAQANELLPYLDYALIKANPKIFLGYSDITMLHFAISHQTGLQTFYGPTTIAEFGEAPEPLPFTTNHLFHVLQEAAGKPVGPLPQSPQWSSGFPDFFYGSQASEVPRTLTPAPGWKWLRRGSARGPIFGGCLPVVVRLSGTKYWPSSKGKILFIENPPGENAKDPFPIARAKAAVADLVNVGVFHDISGLVVGRSAHYSDKLNKEFADVILGLLQDTEFPILMDVDIGHSAPMLTIPVNALTSLDSENNEFSILDTGVVP